MRTSYKISTTGLVYLTVASLTVASTSSPKLALGAESRTLGLYSVDAVTGPSGPFGKRAQDGQIFRTKKINEAGGFTDSCGNTYKIDLKTADMANDAAQAVSLVRQAAGDPSVVAVLGPTPSVGFLAAVPIAGSLKMPLIGIGSGALVAKWNDYSYRINVVSETATPVMFKTLTDKFKFKRLAILYDIKNAPYVDEVKQIRALASTFGYTIVAEQSYQTGDASVRTQLFQIKAANPDWIAFETFGADLALALNQAAELGLGDIPKSSGFDAYNTPNVWDLTNGKAMGGYSWTPKTSVTSTDPEIVAFVAAYKPAMNDDASINSLYGTDAVNLMVDAVKRSCSTDREKVNAAVRATKDLPGLANPITFGKDTGENLAAQSRIVQTTGRAQSVDVR